MHLFGDFGTRGMPGTFQIFLVRVVVQMARSELVLTLPLTVFVDDGGLIGPGIDRIACGNNPVKTKRHANTGCERYPPIRAFSNRDTLVGWAGTQKQNGTRECAERNNTHRRDTKVGNGNN